MGTTTRHKLPYPELSDPPDGATQIGALASAVDDALPLIQTGVVTSQHSASVDGSVDLTYPRAYATPPAVLVTSRRSDFVAATGTPGATGLTIRTRFLNGSSTSIGVAVQWVAVGVPA